MSQYDYSIHLGLGHSGENKLKLDGQWFMINYLLHYDRISREYRKDIVDILILSNNIYK